MTTLVALATKDAVVLGCDSLATINRPMIDPLSLVGDYFDSQNLQLIRDADGEPVLSEFSELLNLAEQVPYNHMSHVDKLLSLAPLPVGVMVTGISAIGDRTVRNLISVFKEKDQAFQGENYTIRTLADRLRAHVSEYYREEFASRPFFQPTLELMVCGYGRNTHFPAIYRIFFPENKIERAIDRFGIAFGGQMQEIQRIVFGTDFGNRLRLEARYRSLLSKYAADVEDMNSESGDDFIVPDAEEFADSYRLFGKLNLGDPDDDREWKLVGLSAQWSDFSNQNAIDCVSFFIKIMIETQRFNTAMPTVGGDLHVGLINKEDGFRWISREEYLHEQHRVTKNKNAADS